MVGLRIWFEQTAANKHYSQRQRRKPYLHNAILSLIELLIDLIHVFESNTVSHHHQGINLARNDVIIKKRLPISASWLFSVAHVDSNILLYRRLAISNEPDSQFHYGANIKSAIQVSEKAYQGRTYFVNPA
jgi:uncharacterized membrane protein YcgQ (UPF0703/DUF1980 family)